MDMTADEVKALLGLKPHPTCGFVAETYRSSAIVPEASLHPGFDGPRPLGSVLTFMVTPEAHIAMHRILSDQMYHHYSGDPLEVLLLPNGGAGKVRIVGSDLAAGHRPQLFIPGGTFHMSRLHAPSLGYALLGTTEWPGVQAPDDVGTGERDPLIAAFPAMADTIRSFMDGTAATVLPRAAAQP
jgi:uncharacterized protein